MRNLISVIGLLCLYACTSKPCLPFEYEAFGLDTSNLVNSWAYVSKAALQDTIHFTQEKIHYQVQEQEVNSFAAYVECANGIAGNIVQGKKIIYQYYLYRMDEGYVFGLSSSCFSSTTKEGIQSMADIDLVVEARDSTCFAQSVVIEDGYIVSFVDTSATEWVSIEKR